MYNKLITSEFINKNYNQNINQQLIIDASKYCYQNFSFSTFPYIVEELNSKQSCERLNSGNCISMSISMKNFLKDKYNIESFLIPATIPKKYSVKGYLNLSHVALAIPRNKNKFYIVDLAFYFINPIKVRTYTDKEQIIFSKNIYSNDEGYKSIDKINSKTGKVIDTLKLNNYQEIPANTIFSECYYCNDKNDKWKYYLTEIKNPDSAISNFFINILNKPFIVTTDVDDKGICNSKYYIKILVDGNLFIQYRKEKPIVIVLNSSNIKSNYNLFIKLEKELAKYFDNSFIKYLISYIQNNKKNFNIKD